MKQNCKICYRNVKKQEVGRMVLIPHANSVLYFAAENNNHYIGNNEARK